MRRARLLPAAIAALSTAAACEANLGFRPPERPSRVSVAGIPHGLLVRFPAAEEATGYVLRWTTGADAAVRRLSCEAPPCTIDGLSPEVTHTVQVSTRDRVGESDPSAPVAARPLRGDEILLRRAWEYTTETGGVSVAGAGDMDGDGDGELVIGEPSAGANDNGRIRLFTGDRLGLGDTFARELVGAPDTRLGGSLAAGGDVNEDGFGDLIVGSPGADGNPGRVLLFRGGIAGLGASPAWTGSTLQDSARSGAAVVSGDVNGDGLADLVAGAPGWLNKDSFTGRVDLYLGPGPASGALFPAAVNATGGHYESAFGGAVALVDIDLDGFDDLVVGAPLVEGAGIVPVPFQGEVQVRRWDPVNETWGQALVMVGEGENALLGSSLASAGDTDGDGSEELLIGSPGHIGTYYAEGEAYLYESGSAGLGEAPVWSANGENAAAAFGQSLAGPGDLNLDGYDDVVVGSPGEGLSGRVHVLFGSPGGLARELVFDGRDVSEGFGSVIASAGDVNGDGFPDLACATLEGRVEVILGGRPASSPIVDAGPRIEGHAGTVVRTSAATFVDEVPDASFTCTWTWGDGTTDVIAGCEPGEAPAEHVFAEPGEYDVVLRVLGTDSRMGEAITSAGIR